MSMVACGEMGMTLRYAAANAGKNWQQEGDKCKRLWLQHMEQMHTKAIMQWLKIYLE